MSEEPRYTEPIADPPASLAEAWKTLITFTAGELIELAHKHGCIGPDDSEKCWYVTHQILTANDVSKLLSNEVARLLGVGVQS